MLAVSPGHVRGSILRTRSLIAAALLLGGSLLASTPRPALAQTPTPVALAACPANATVSVTQQAPGSSTVVVTVTPAVTIKAAADADPQSFHVHYYVDTPTGALKGGDVVPAGNPQIVHSGATTLDLKLAAGQHTVTVVLGQLGHQACADSTGKLIAGTATFTVAAQAAPTATVAAPKTGNAGLVATTGSTGATALAITLGVLTLGGAAAARRRA